jgi:tyrosine-specific transport protein
MLALPVLTSLGGFLPSLVIYFFCWLFMASTGLLFLEVTEWVQKDGNITTMAERTLGFWGKSFAWILYLFLFYCLTLAYIVGCGSFISQLAPNLISGWVGGLLFVLMAAPLVYVGTKIVGKLNVFLMAGLGICYLGFVILGLPFVNVEQLRHQNWTLSLMALPVTFTAFAYQGTIPTLVNYLDHDLKKSRLAIIIGSFLPLILYAVWQWLILGIVPAEGPHGLEEALKNGDNAVTPLKYFIQNPTVYLFSQFFAFFALITSFFGVTLGLMDFLADGLKIEKTSIGKGILSLIIFIPPLIIAYFFPHVFLKALDLAGGLGCALLLGLLPIMMVWIGRYRLRLRSEYSLFGGKTVLVLLTFFVVIELCCELAFTL